MFEIGDRVKVNDVNSYNYGLVGTVTGIRNKIVVVVQFGSYSANFYSYSLRHLNKIIKCQIEVYDNV